jgi:heterodisulfide reductase subunit A-like polyferredoxin
MPALRERYDALVIGGGIAGLQAELDLGEQGLDVLLVEKEP